MPAKIIPFPSWPDGLNRMICSLRFGGFHSRSAPARGAIQGSQPVVSAPVLTRARGGFIWISAMVPKRMIFSIRRARVAKSFMALMVALRMCKRSFKSLWLSSLQPVIDIKPERTYFSDIRYGRSQI